MPQEVSKLRAVWPTPGAFSRTMEEVGAHSWPHETDEVFVIYFVFSYNNILLNNIKNRWPGAAPTIGIVKFSYITP